MIEISNLKKGYQKKEVISSGNLLIEDDKITFLMGENGSGKTTLIKCILDMESYDGKILFDEKPVKDVRNQCMVIFDDCPFYTNLTGIKNLLLLSEYQKDKQTIYNMAEQYLTRDILHTKVKSYSYGQKKKLALALVEILNPNYLFMDEISNGLDYETLKFLKERLLLWKKKKNIFLTGHQFSFYNDLVDEVYLFKNKEIVHYQNFTDSGSRLEDIYDEKIH